MITYANAEKALEAAVIKAKELGISIAVTIVDEAGAIIGDHQMPGALSINAELSEAKAITAAFLGRPSGSIAPYGVEDQNPLVTKTAFGPKFTKLRGGVPVKINGKVVGAIGVDGLRSNSSQSSACAKAAAVALAR